MTDSIGTYNLRLWFKERKITFFETHDGVFHFNPENLTGSFEEIFLNGDHQKLVRVYGLATGCKIVFDDYDSVFRLPNESGSSIVFPSVSEWWRFFNDYIALSGHNVSPLATYGAVETQRPHIKSYRIVDPNKKYPITEIVVSSKNGLTARLFAAEAMTGSHADEIDSIQLEEILKSLIAFPIFEDKNHDACCSA